MKEQTPESQNLKESRMDQARNIVGTGLLWGVFTPQAAAVVAGFSYLSERILQKDLYAPNAPFLYVFGGAVLSSLLVHYLVKEDE